MKNILAVVFMLLILRPVSAQEESVDAMLDEFLFGKNAQDSLLESVLINETDINELLDAISNFRFIYVRSEFENKTFFSGQDIGIDQYNISGQIFYQGSKGLNIGIDGFYYSDFNPKYNTTVAYVGYNNRIKGLSGASLRASYNRFFFAKVDSIEENAFNNSVNLGATYHIKHLGTSADFSYLFGNETSTQISWDLFSDFTILRFGMFNKLKFIPEMSLYFGNETVIVSQYVNFGKFPVEVFSEKNVFGLMNTVLRIPLSLSLGNLDMRAGYNFNFPRIPGGDSKPENTSFFNISVGYIFGL